MNAPNTHHVNEHVNVAGNAVIDVLIEYEHQEVEAAGIYGAGYDAEEKREHDILRP